MAENEPIKLCVMMNEKRVGPVVLRQNVSELALVVPLRAGVFRPFDCGAVRPETRIADIGFRRKLLQRVVVTEISLKVKDDYLHQAFSFGSRSSRYPRLMLARTV